MKTSTSLRAAVALALGLAATPVLAEDPALAAEVAALRAAISEQRAALDAQAKLLEAQQAKLEALTQRLAETVAPASSVASAKASEAPRLALNNTRPVITSADGKSSFAVRANVQLDAAVYGEAKEGPLTTDYRRGSVGGAGNRETNAARDFSNGIFVRRTRFGFDGAFAGNFNYRLLLEFGSGGGTEGPARVNDAWIAYTGLAPFTFQLGAFSPPANMDDSTSAEDLPFLERASASELSRALAAADGRFGLAMKSGGKRWMSSLAVTSRTAGDAEAFDSQFAAVGRAAFLAATSDDYNVHLGLSGSHVFSPPDQGPGSTPRHPLRLRDRPEVRVDSTRLIDSGSIDGAHASVFGAELAANWRNFYLQGENFWFDVERRDATLADPSFGGYYLQGSWVITGENRRYNPANGSFQNPRARQPFSRDGGIGAWELAARYSSMDLNFDEGMDGTAAVAGSVRGGEQSIFTLGVNWYLNPNFKLMMNYLLIDVDRLNPAGPGNTAPFGASPATPPTGVQIGQDLDVFALRSQFSF
jgi:phosphate-selective porin OprO/OprP